MANDVLVSGITPSGALTIGNYIGAIKHFVKLQESHAMYVFVANLHAITADFDAKRLAENTKAAAALYLACGLDPAKTVVFVQSDVHEHAQMGHLLLCHTTLGELSRMTQFKDKGKKGGVNGTSYVRTGLLTYPALMAADILLYDAKAVPVGADQKQHLELTRDIANRVNNRYGRLFTVPEPLIAKQGAKVMSLTDPTKKMSKSSDDPNSYVALLDDPQKARKKIMASVTDSLRTIEYDPVNRPGVANLLLMLAELREQDVKKVARDYADKSYKDLKTDLADAVADLLTKIQKRYRAVTEGDALGRILEAGAQRAKAVAAKKLAAVQDAMGVKH